MTGRRCKQFVFWRARNNQSRQIAQFRHTITTTAQHLATPLSRCDDRRRQKEKNLTTRIERHTCGREWVLKRGHVNFNSCCWVCLCIRLMEITSIEAAVSCIATIIEYCSAIKSDCWHICWCIDVLCVRNVCVHTTQKVRCPARNILAEWE